MITNLIKLLLGVILAIALLAGGGVATALFLMNRIVPAPVKPVFNNDDPAIREKAAQSNPGKTPNQASSSPTPTKTSDAKTLPPGAYTARVTWPDGLSLRKEANADAEKLTGVAFNQQVTVLEESPDKNWQKIRLQDSDTEGWIKAGNTESSDGQAQPKEQPAKQRPTQQTQPDQQTQTDQPKPRRQRRKPRKAQTEQPPQDQQDQ